MKRTAENVPSYTIHSTISSALAPAQRSPVIQQKQFKGDKNWTRVVATFGPFFRIREKSSNISKKKKQFSFTASHVNAFTGITLPKVARKSRNAQIPTNTVGNSTSCSSREVGPTITNRFANGSVCRLFDVKAVEPIAGKSCGLFTATELFTITSVGPNKMYVHLSMPKPIKINSVYVNHTTAMEFKVIAVVFCLLFISFLKSEKNFVKRMWRMGEKKECTPCHMLLKGLKCDGDKMEQMNSLCKLMLSKTRRHRKIQMRSLKKRDDGLRNGMNRWLYNVLWQLVFCTFSIRVHLQRDRFLIPGTEGILRLRSHEVTKKILWEKLEGKIFDNGREETMPLFNALGHL
ncbi:hypothetical protein Bhyg_12361 [Pseudolycoriella hygida]|uniref:Uncharacterized protein n=1 Tax=Pseudolycoriella hygida TaxID=35572 RepID=A0A9Q0MY44_9DIPT|nr:hypothetical protein Bhyg_12361 [Pseudolycoriella hygida]